MINVVVLQGRLVADPELRTTQNGVSVARFRVAVDRDFAGQGSNRQADFIDIVAWRGTAEFVCKYFTKGQMIALHGRIQTRSYEDKNGNKRTAVEVVAENVSFCGQRDAGPKREPSEMNPPGSAPDRYGSNGAGQQRPPREENGVGYWKEGRAAQPTEPPEEEYENMVLDDEDLPF